MAVTYTVRWRPSGATEWAPEDQVTGLTSTSHAIDALSAGTRYEVQVIAVSDGGATSAPVQSGRWTVCAAPAQPTAADVLAETAGLSWPTVTGATEYRVTRTPTGGGTSTPVATVAAPESGDPSVAVTGLTEESGYDLTVTAVNADGDVSGASTVRSITTTALATGGTVTAGTGTADGYRLHTFTDTTSAATFTLNAVRDVEYLVVGGGGSGTRGWCNIHWGHGGGGGGVSAGTLTALATGAHTVTVGAGGASSTTASCDVAHRGNHGGDSALVRASDGASLASATGGRGSVGAGTVDGVTATAVGGASGTGTFDGVAYVAFAGGNGTSGGQYGSGGGGGAGGAGSVLDGGSGRTSSITGTSVVYGSGGAGRIAAGYGTPGDGGGAGTDGAANRGGGGSDGFGGSFAFTAGGAGVVVLRYPVAPGD